jgi:hypothetical protein
MKTIKPFIDLGFHTVPLEGKLKRLENGEKNTPIFTKGWKQHFQENYNEKATALGGTITGAISGIIAIDCDNTNTTAIFTALDPGNKFAFESLGKLDKKTGEPKDGITLIYRYSDALANSFGINNGDLALDFYSDNGFVYLPTDANSTKVRWAEETFEELPKIKEAPPQVIALLKQLYVSTHKPVDSPNTKPAPVTSANYLNPQIQQLVTKKEFIPGLFRIITPKDFRDLEQYVKYGYLHPKNIPEGRGSEYLSKISAILGRDSSIDTEIYSKAIYAINDLWDDPIPRKRLDTTIINPMVSGNASIDGESIWHYDQYWHTHGLIVSSKRGESLEIFFDDMRAMYYIVDLANCQVKSFSRDADLASFVETVAVNPPLRKELKPSLPLINVESSPAHSFGFFAKDEYTRAFNKFVQTPYLAILDKPEAYETSYKYPKNIMNYMRTLIPDNATRAYVLGFLKRKLTTFEYSPVVLYFLGKPGSGKDTFISLLNLIMGPGTIAKPTTKEFLEMYNGWMVDKYFAQLDEYGDQLSRQSDKDEALGKIKAYSGKADLQIRQMRTDGFDYRHNITIIMTANRNPLMIDSDDRRVVLIETPNVLSTQPWVNEAGGIAELVTNVLPGELSDFCYYLATNVEILTRDEYVTPPASAAKHRVIADMMSAGNRLAYLFKNTMFNQMDELLDEHNMQRIATDWHYGRADEDDMFDLYTLMTDGQGTKRGLAKIFSNSGFAKIPTTRNGAKAYYFDIPNLKGYQVKPFSQVKEVDVYV